jgi:hypothetical protein
LTKKQKKKPTSFTLPEDTMKNLKAEAELLGISSSELLARKISEANINPQPTDTVADLYRKVEECKKKINEYNLVAGKREQTGCYWQGAKFSVQSGVWTYDHDIDGHLVPNQERLDAEQQEAVFRATIANYRDFSAEEYHQLVKEYAKQHNIKLDENKSDYQENLLKAEQGFNQTPTGQTIAQYRSSCYAQAREDGDRTLMDILDEWEKWKQLIRELKAEIRKREKGS